MTLDAYALWLFIAGALTGIGVTVLAVFVGPAFPKLFEDVRRYWRSRRQPPGEPKPL